MVIALGAATAFPDEVKASAEYPEFYSGDTTAGIDFVQSIKVLAPRYCSNVKGDITVVFEAKSMTRAVAKCWRQPDAGDGWGRDAVLFDGELGADGHGEFVFLADSFPNGPLTVDVALLYDKFTKSFDLFGQKAFEHGLAYGGAPEGVGLIVTLPELGQAVVVV